MAANNHNFFHAIVTIVYVLIKDLLSAFVWIMVAALGVFLLRNLKPPLELIIGLPLLLGGGGLAVNSFGSVLLVIFDSAYNRGVCPLCRRD